MQLQGGAVDGVHVAEGLAQAAQAQADAGREVRAAAVRSCRLDRYEATLPFALRRYSGGAAMSSSSSAGIALAS